MAKSKSASLGTASIGSLLVKQAVPASIGILVMSLNMIVDTIFVGRWIGPLAISAITVVIPVTFFIGAIGLVEVRYSNARWVQETMIKHFAYSETK